MAPELKYRADSEGPIAVYVQIENQVQFAIAAGSLKSGDSLPSVRDLSSDLNVNPNTVTKAYRDLELLGLVTTRRGIGVKVADGARATCKKRVDDLVMHHLQEAVAECLMAGVPKPKIRKLVSDTIASGRPPYSPR